MNPRISGRWLALALIALPASPLANKWGPIDVNADYGDLNITHESDVLNSEALLRISNGEDFRVRCEVTFRNGPEAPVNRRGSVSAGGSTLFRTSLRRSVVRLVIDSRCQPEEEGSSEE